MPRHGSRRLKRIRAAPTSCSTSAETRTAILRADSRSHTMRISWPRWPQGFPYALVSQSLGPFHPVNRPLARYLLAIARALVYVREHRTRDDPRASSACEPERMLQVARRRVCASVRSAPSPSGRRRIWILTASLGRGSPVSMSDLALRLSEGTSRNRYVDEMARAGAAPAGRATARRCSWSRTRSIRPTTGRTIEAPPTCSLEGLGRPAWMHSIRGDYGPSVLKGFIGECDAVVAVAHACRHCRPFLGGADASRVLVAQVPGPDGGHRTRGLRLGSVRRRCWKHWTSSSIGSGSGEIACENGCATIRLEPGDRSPACARASRPASRAAPTCRAALPRRRARRPDDDGRGRSLGLRKLRHRSTIGRETSRMSFRAFRS